MIGLITSNPILWIRMSTTADQLKEKFVDVYESFFKVIIRIIYLQTIIGK